MNPIKPSLPKGTRDFLPEQMHRRQYVLGKVKDVFERFGYAPLETPSFEKLEVLSGKYGDEGEKLILRLLKRGTGLESLLGEKTKFVVEDYHQLVEEALRYDLTVPLSRVIAMHQNELTLPFKRYQIQPVWRGDRPQKGRYREFYQCDVDTVGTDSMLADAETIAVVSEVLETLGFDSFKIRINSRKVLNGILSFAGVPPENGVSTLIAIDKLDKIGMEGVSDELLSRGLEEHQIKDIFRILETKGAPAEVLSHLTSTYSEEEILFQGATELSEVIELLNELGVSADRYCIDLSLARGLGYYTGPIYEAIVEEPKIGSLAGGGRYDGLIGLFLGRDIPATGVALGIERIIDVMMELNMFPEETTKTCVLVALFDDATRSASLAYAQQLRKAGIQTETFHQVAKLKKQFVYADRKGIPFVAIIGPDEVEAKKVSLKDLRTEEQTQLDLSESVAFLRANVS